MTAPHTYPTDITPLGAEVFAIDTRMAGYPGVTCSYLIRSERPCLIEVGAAGSAPLLRDSLAALGIEAGDLATVVVTHIHLDHAGGTGDIAAMFPQAEIVVHERGARHLADPARLMRSARDVWGDKLEMLFGELRPTDAPRIRAVTDIGEIRLGPGRTLGTHYTPGHAKHHIGLVDSATGDLYVGDAAGVYDQRTGDMRPATPPPDFDLDAALASLALLSDIAPRRIMFSHFGAVEEAGPLLARAKEELHVWVAAVQDARSTKGDLDHAIAMVRDRVVARYQPLPDAASEESREVMDLLSGAETNTAGIWHWLDRLEAERGKPGEA